MLTRLSQIHSQHGQTMTETAVLMSLIVIVVLVAVLFFGGRVGALWTMLSSALPGG